jgi:hypothetical protein
VLNAEQERERIKIRAEQHFDELISKRGQEIFWVEFAVLRCGSKMPI